AAAKKVSGDQVRELTKLYDDLIATGGALVFAGVGKSGLVANKLAATFSSLGLRSFFLHPTEAMHGDLGRVGPTDGVVLLSKSGTTEELIKLLPYLPVPKQRIVGLLGEVRSTLGERCGIVFHCSVEKEACINNQAPTTSSTVALAVGD